jgi:hypothetical protein
VNFLLKVWRQANATTKGKLPDYEANDTSFLEMVEEGANELAAIAGRIQPLVSAVDYEQTRRELTSESNIDVQAATLESMPESERWDPVPGSTGCHMPDSLGVVLPAATSASAP